MYHYTYRITNKKLNKHYYGTRSCQIKPIEDIGFKYFSSSADEEFIKDQKLNGKDYKYKIVKIFKTRKEAMGLEIILHNKFDVALNENFYNKAKQTSTGFDRTGVIVTEEVRQKMSRGSLNPSSETRFKNGSHMRGKKHTDEFKNHLSKLFTGREVSEETRLKIGESSKGRLKSEETKDKMRGENNPNYGKTTSDAVKNAISKAHKNKIVSGVTKDKLSEAARNRKLITCPHCGMESQPGAMKRWHFDNCKLKKEK